MKWGGSEVVRAVSMRNSKFFGIPFISCVLIIVIYSFSRGMYIKFKGRLTMISITFDLILMRLQLVVTRF